MDLPRVRRPVAVAVLAVFALFWASTIAEAWCTMHEGRAVATRASSPVSHDGHARHDPAIPDPSDDPSCCCPGDCSGPVAVRLATSPPRFTAPLADLDTRAPDESSDVAPAHDQLRLPYATAPPVA